jgi:hypothetical protein
MARIVRQYGIGIVSETFEPRDLAKALSALTEADLRAFKASTHAAAAALNFESSVGVFISLVESLLRAEISPM